MAKKKVTKKKRSAKNTRRSLNSRSNTGSSSDYKKEKKKRSKSRKKVKIKNPYNKKLMNKNQGAWNGIKFGVNSKKINPVSSMTIQKSVDIDEESSNLNYSPATIEMTTKLLPELGNDILYQYRKWTSNIKKYDYLFMGGKRVWLVPVMLKDVSVGVPNIDDLGRLRTAEITLTFEEWDAKQRAKTHKKWLKEQEKKKSKKKKKLAVGVWVKIKGSKYYGGKLKISAKVKSKKYKVAKIVKGRVYLVGLKNPIKKSDLSVLSTSSGSVKGSGTGARIAKAAMSKKGCRYVWGASGPSTFDCSGLVWWAHNHCGIKFGRTDTRGLSSKGKHISSLSSAKAGDVLIFSSNGAYSGIHHTGIYIGGGKMVHAPHSGATVTTATVTSGYYHKQLYTIRRLY